MDRPIHNQKPLDIPHAGTDPFALFSCWFDEARQTDAANAAVAALATVSRENRPSLRMILLKGYSPKGFLFYTNYESRKAAELAANPFAAMTLWWPAQERQVRIEGKIEKTSAAESDAYFAIRPRESQLSAWASPQSRVIGQPITLDEQRKRFEGDEIPRPATWGGFLLVPDIIEFWQGRANRLHDRIRFTRTDTKWKIDRLAP